MNLQGASMGLRAVVTLAVCLGLLTGITSGASAQASGASDASPPASSSHDASAAPEGDAEQLGGMWRRLPRAPFGATDAAGVWTGDELVVLDPETRRAAVYDPAADAWHRASRAPHRLSAFSPAVWTGTEMIIVDRGAEGRHAALGYDPDADTWRRLPRPPMDRVSAAVWADGSVIAASGFDMSAAAYDPATGTWTELPPIPAATSSLPIETSVALYWTGDEVLAVTAPFDPAGSTLAVSSMDPATGEWAETSTGPLSILAGNGVWTGDELVFLTLDTEEDGGPLDGRFDPATDTWTPEVSDCPIDSSGAIWTGTLIVNAPMGAALAPRTGTCYALPAAPRPPLSGAVTAWTGEEILLWSGHPGELLPPRRGGLTYRPPAVDADTNAAEGPGPTP